jgi:hypothetical protein
MRITHYMAVTSAAVLLIAAGVAAASNTFLSTWTNPVAAPLNFVGRKVATVVIVDDQSLRMSAEEALAREITARGPVGVASYRLVPKEEFTDKDRVKVWFDKANIEGAVVLRLVATDKQKVYSAVVWSSGYYANPWDYYGYGWATPYALGKGHIETTITIETLLYDITGAKLIWAGVSRTTDPKDVASFTKQLVKDVAKNLEKEKLIK